MKKATIAAFAVAALSVAMGSQPAHAQFYVRGDVGWSIGRDADIKDKNFPLDGVICGDAACTTPGKLDDIGSSVLFGGGVGYRISPQFRTDVTYTYRGGYDLDDNDQLAPPTNFKADIRSHAFLANVYWDVPVNIGPVRPYIGAGVGWARNIIGEGSATNPAAPGVTLTAPGGTKSNFAWQAGAGISLELTKQLAIDIGYRYFDAGRIETDAGNVIIGGVVVGPYSGAKGDLAAHEFVGSVRFGF